MPIVNSKENKRINNLRLELNTGFNRSRVPKKLTAQQKEQRRVLLAELEAQQDAKAEGRCQHINAHTTKEADRGMTHTTSEATGINGAFIQGFSLATGKDVAEMMMMDDYDKLKKDKKEAMANHCEHIDRA